MYWSSYSFWIYAVSKWFAQIILTVELNICIFTLFPIIPVSRRSVTSSFWSYWRTPVSSRSISSTRPSTKTLRTTFEPRVKSSSVWCCFSCWSAKSWRWSTTGEGEEQTVTLVPFHTNYSNPTIVWKILSEFYWVVPEVNNLADESQAS